MHAGMARALVDQGVGADFDESPLYIREARKGTEDFLAEVEVDGPGIYGDPAAWRGVPREL